jgi:hypothetical protein
MILTFALYQLRNNNLIQYIMNKGNLLSAVLLTGTFLLSATVLLAQPPSGTPIDGGLSLVLGSCAIYGAKKIRDSRKKN